MANWTTLKAAIANVIKTNGNQEITGQLLQNVLNNIVSSLGENATFAGIATPTTNPGVPDGPVFYIASEAGTYTNFGGVSLNNGLTIFYNSTSGIWNRSILYECLQELGNSDKFPASQCSVSKILLNSNSFWYKGNIRNTDIKILECIIDYRITYGDNKLLKKSFKLLQTGYSVSSGYENQFIFYAIRDDGIIYNFTAELASGDRVGIKEYSNTIGMYTATIAFNWDIYNNYFENRYSAPNDEALGDGIHVLSQLDTEQDYSASHLFMRNSYIRQQERNFFECIYELSISTNIGGDIFKVLQIGRSVNTPGGVALNFRNVLTGEVIGFSIKESDYTGIKTYNAENNNGIVLKITLDWDKLLSRFSDYYTPLSIETTTNGLFIQSLANSYGRINESNSINQFNGDNQIEDNERLILQCLRMYKVITLDKPYEFKLLQTGFSTSENKVIFYMGIRNADNSLTYVHAVPQEDASSLDELEGVKRYETEVYSSACGKVKQIVVIDWDKYKELFANRYSPTSVEEYGGNRICVVSDVQNNLSDVQNNLSLAINNVENKDIIAFSPTTLTEYFRNGYVVYNVPFERNGILKKITTNIFKHNYSTMQLTLLIGRIDQRNWLIDTREYSYSFSELGISENYSNTNLTIDLSEKNIRVKEGEVICLFSRRYTDSSDGKSFLIARNDNNAENVLFSTKLDGVFTPYKEFARFSYSVTYFDTDFADKETVADIKNDVTALTETINLSSIFVDLSTGKRYKIVVNNGSIQLKNVDYSKILFIGSSHVNHGISSDVGWYRNGAMAPSIGAHSLPNLVLEGLKSRNQECTLNIMSSIDWERNYNTTFDFDASWKSTLQSENPDVIFMHISGNSTWTEEFEAACELMIENVKKTCPLADIFIAASWPGGQKATDMRTACNNKGAAYVDLSSYKVSSSMWKAGDWYYAEDDSQYHGIYQAVVSHPNDIGCLLQANAFLRSCGYDEIQGTHTITIDASDGISVSTPNTTWLKDGIVTIRIKSGNVTQFTVNKASGGTVEATLRTNELNENYNTYYTFTMPDEDVIISIE